MWTVRIIYSIKLIILLFFSLAIQAKVVNIDIQQRTVVANGHLFAQAGAYEKLKGTVEFAFDGEKNLNIIDIENAPKKDDGLVHARANFFVLQPIDKKKRRNVALLEVSNRGGKAMIRYLNRAQQSTNDPTTQSELGDGFLMQLGLTLIWVGWQYDIPHENQQMSLFDIPVAQSRSGESIVGLVRSDWVIDQTVSSLSLGHRVLDAYYPMLDPQGITTQLFRRTSRDGPRQLIPKSQWQAGQIKAGALQPSMKHITLKEGFKAGNIYEMVYQAQDPVVSGIGLAVVRDMISYAKYDSQSPFKVDQGIALGISQTGRFLRHFLYQKFNQDEQNRKAFDGMLIHTAGAGRGSFNHRFAQPSRDAHRYSAFFYPTDLFPFASAKLTAPDGNSQQGLLDDIPSTLLPKIFYTNTGYEYWGRAAALIHSHYDQKQDLELHQNERVYHFASGQHFVVPFPPRKTAQIKANVYKGSPVNYLENLRALTQAMVLWVSDNRMPPKSQYPTWKHQQLTEVKALNWPTISGIQAPQVNHSVYQLDYGPRFLTQGIIDHQPGKIIKSFAPPVPQVDNIGNEASGIRTIELRAPLATYAPWHLRYGLNNESELVDFYGTMIPLAKTEQQRRTTGDSRPSLEALYPKGAIDYFKQVEQGIDQLVQQGVLLEQDKEGVYQRAKAQWQWFTSTSDQ